MKERRPKKYKHIIQGAWLEMAEGVVYTNWQVGAFKEVGKIVFGQDYGFSSDPTTLIKTSIDKDNKIIYAQQCYCKTHR